MDDHSYLIVRGFYSDCPTCDGVVEDPEYITTDVVEGTKQLVQKLCSDLNEFDDVAHLKIYKILYGGRMHFMCDIEPVKGFHALKGIKFKLHDKEYEIHKFEGKYQLKTPQYKVLYDKA